MRTGLRLPVNVQLSGKNDLDAERKISHYYKELGHSSSGTQCSTVDSYELRRKITYHLPPVALHPVKRGTCNVRVQGQHYIQM
jgi:hypothetical protein